MQASPFSVPISRRTVLKKGLQLSALAGTVGLPFKSFSQTPHLTAELTEESTQIRYSACLVNCGSRCPIKVHVKNKKIIKISTEDGIDESITGQHQIRPCLRGRSSRWRVYHPDRLKYPMLRVGKRGEGKFKRITWDEATTIVAEKLKYTIEKYGNEAVYYQYGSGTTGANLQGRNAGKRLLNLAGGFLEMYGSYSTAQITFAIPFILGQNTNGSLLGQAKYSDLVVMFGHNLAATRMSGGGQLYEFNQALAQSKAKVITIDPRYTESTTAFDAQWIPIKPGTDGALVAALIYSMLQENRLDEEMINRYCVGWDSSTLPESAAPHSDYKSYLLGLGEDKTVKTPQWASQLTGIPVKNIIQLAREISSAKSAFIAQGWGIQRAHQGEHAALSIIMLSIVTGHFGRPGTNVGTWGASVPYAVPGLSIPNPVKVAIPTFMWTDAISRGTEMTATRDGVRGRERLQTGIKFLWHYASNITYNQHSDLNKTHDVLVDESLCEFIVIWDNHMTASAKYADLLLPDVSALESDDLINSSYASGAYQFITRLQKAIEPLWECRLSYDVFAEIADKMGIGEKFTEGRTYQQWLEYSYQGLREKEPHLPPFEQTDGMGVVSRKFTHADEKTGIELRTFREDPQANPLKTPSGKVEIYSERLAKIGQTWELRPGDAIPPIPRYCPTIEGVESPLREKYPLQMIGFHTKGHCHSTYPNIEQLVEVAPDRVWINPIDAQKYGINHNALVEIFNDRGRIHMRAKVTPNIIPGVIAVPQGAWAKTDSHGVDIGGCINRLTTQHPAPLSKGNPQHTNLVDIKRV